MLERRRTPRHQLGRVAAILSGSGAERSCLVKDFSPTAASGCKRTTSKFQMSSCCSFRQTSLRKVADTDAHRQNGRQEEILHPAFSQFLTATMGWTAHRISDNAQATSALFGLDCLRRIGARIASSKYPSAEMVDPAKHPSAMKG
jgi:hypothetical protein